MSKNVYHEARRAIYLFRNILIVLSFNIRCICTFATPSNLPLWTWDCVNDKCISSKATELDKLQSLETCNMLCSSIKLWPMPTGFVSWARTAVPTRSDLFELGIVSAPTDSIHRHLRDAFELFRHDLRKKDYIDNVCSHCHKIIIHLSVTENDDVRMRINTDESYNFLLYPMNLTGALLANITALSFCGARHGLETLLQLVWLDSYAGSLQILKEANIKDSPKFRYRGLMIDTANTYFPVNVLLRTIDAMASSKLNTFHWHVSDSQAFSLQFKSVPELTKYSEHYGQRDAYTTDQVRAIVRRARLRGIRVLIEVDTPAHVGRAWEFHVTEDVENLVHCIDSEPWPAYCLNPPCGQLNPTSLQVFRILQDLYSEIIELTGIDDLFHLGGSDISERCWAETLNDSDTTELWIDYTKSALMSLKSATGNLPNLTLFWASRLSERFKSDFVEYVHAMGLQTRKNARANKYVIGLRTVISNEDSWDLNSGLGDWFDANGGVPYNSWQRVYEHRPWARDIVSNIEGGEATVWSERIGVDELESHVWPRAAALAERLWSDRAEGVTRLVQARLDVHRTRLISQGVQAAPIWSNWCTQNIYTCI